MIDSGLLWSSTDSKCGQTRLDISTLSSQENGGGGWWGVLLITLPRLPRVREQKVDNHGVWIDYLLFWFCFFKLNNAFLNWWSQLCSLLGSDSFSSDWLQSTNSYAEDLNRFLLCFIREENNSMLLCPQDGVFYCCFLKFRAATVSLLSKYKHKCQCFDGSDHQNWHDTRN